MDSGSTEKKEDTVDGGENDSETAEGIPFEEDYHDSMDGESYKCYFEKSICQNIPKHSVIVIDNASYHSKNTKITPLASGESPGGTPILGHIRDVRPEWVTFPGRKPADGCKFLTKNLRMGHNFDIILPGNGWFSSKLNKTYCSLVNFYCK